MDLNSLMTIDHVVYVRADGTVTDEGITGVYAPEVICDYDGPFADAQITSAHDAEMVESIERQGWSVLKGWSRQYLTRADDPIMHTSEFIGGRIEEHIRETPGYWVACSVALHPGEDDPEYEDGNGESETAGWILCHREDV